MQSMYRQRSIRRHGHALGIAALAIATSLAIGACSSGSEPGFDSDPGPTDSGGDAGGELLVEPLNDYRVTGFEGGPFSPASRSYSLSNVGDEALAWEASVSGAWLQITGPSAGALLPGASVDVVVEVSDYATFLLQGAYAGSIEFVNATDGTGDTTAYAQLNILSDAAGGSLLVVAPLESFTSAGPEGGPFTPDTKTYGLSNVGDQPLDWSVAFSENWVRTSGPSGGSLAPGASVDVPIVFAAAAAQLPPGRHTAAIDFENATDGNGDTTVLAELDVLGEGTLMVSPGEDFLSAGPPGGPFMPAQKAYQLTNTGEQGLAWQVSLSESWLEVNGASSGNLAPQQSVQVIVLIASAAQSLAAGSYSGTITVTNATSGNGGASLGATLDVLGAGVLAVTPLEDFVSSGPVGGPFAPSSKTYSLSNIGTDTIGWSVTETAGWLAVAGASSGTLTPGQAVNVVLQLTGSATSLTAGNYSGDIAFTNTTNGNGNRSADAMLHVLVPGTLRVAPNESFVSAGPPGGPFTPPAKTYTLTNTGQLPIAWSASDSVGWLTLGPSSGTLNPAASTHVVVEVTNSANSLPAGAYHGTITFTNQTNGNGNLSHNARLDVLGAGSLSVSPGDDFHSAGPVGGPFIPASKSYSLTNVGTQILSWSLGLSGSWLTSSGPTSGSLSPGQSTNVIVAVASSADGLTGGLYRGNLTFTNATNGSGNANRGAQLMVSAEGWTDLTPSADSRLVFVSSSTGSDSNNGLSEQSPKATIAAGYALIRDGFPDWLQLREGDNFPQFSGISLNKSGRSPGEPIVLTTYGSADVRPVVNTNGAPGVTMSNVSNIVIAHLDLDPTDGVAQFRPDGSHPRAVFVYENCHDILIEGCRFTNFGAGIECGPLSEENANTNIAIRRNVIDTTYTMTSGQSTQGLLVRLTNGLLIEENFFEHCGWSSEDPRSEPPNGLDHAIYIQMNNTGCVHRGNIVTRPSAAAMQCRSGGLIENNFVTESACGFRIGGAGATSEPLGWVQATLQGNVAIDGIDYNGQHGVATAVRIHNAGGVVVRDNVFANTLQTSSNQARAINFEPHLSWGNRAITIEDNIVYDWGGRAVMIMSHASMEATDWRFRRNQFQDSASSTQDLFLISSTHEASAIVETSDNEYWGTSAQSGWFRVGSTEYDVAEFNALMDDTSSSVSAEDYPDPTRDLGDYMTSLGAGSTLEDFVDEAVLQSQFNWRLEYCAEAVNNFIRAGFGLPPL